MSGPPELQPGETGTAYFSRLREHYKNWADPTGVVALTTAASVAALAIGDRNEKIQRAMAEDVRRMREAIEKFVGAGGP